MAPPVPDSLAEYLYQSQPLPSPSPAVNRGRRLDRDVQCRLRFECHRALPRKLSRGGGPFSRKRIIHKIIDFVARDDPGSLPACALVSRRWNSRATYHLKIMFSALSISRLPVELIHKIIDFVAQRDRASLPSCALVSRRWNSRATYHLQKTMPYHHIRISSFQEFSAFFDAINNDGYLGQCTKSLHIAPDPKASPASSSYIPFLDLSSRTLPNVNRLILGDSLRWTDYPPLYHNGAALGSPFYSVTILDLFCRFRSLQSFVLAVRSFRNLQQVRLLHPDPFLSPVAEGQTWIIAHGGAHSALGKSMLRKPLQLLEVPLSVLPYVKYVFGDNAAKLLVRWSPPSALPSIGKVSQEPLPSLSSFVALETVELTVPGTPKGINTSSNGSPERLDRLAESHGIGSQSGIDYSMSLSPRSGTGQERVRVSHRLERRGHRRRLDAFWTAGRSDLQVSSAAGG